MSARTIVIFIVIAIAAIAVGWISLPGADHHYVAKRSDSVCGLRDVRQLSNPALVDYPRVLAATPESERIRKEGIDPASAQGTILQARARSRVLEACQRVRKAQGHCSIWRAIRRRDGKPVADVTELVLAGVREGDDLGHAGLPYTPEPADDR